MQPPLAQGRRKHQRGGQAAKISHAFPRGQDPTRLQPQHWPLANAPAPRMFSKEAAPLAREEESFISKTKVRFANQDCKEQGKKKKPAMTLSSKC